MELKDKVLELDNLLSIFAVLVTQNIDLLPYVKPLTFLLGGELKTAKSHFKKSDFQV